MNMGVIIGEQEYTEILQLLSGILRNDGVSVEIVERCVDGVINTGFDRNVVLGMEESNRACSIRVFVEALLEAAKWREIDPIGE